MFNFGENKSSATYGALIDIGSGTVGVAIVSSHPQKKIPTILYSHRTTMRITQGNTQNDGQFRRIREALFSASLLLSQEGEQALLAHDTHAKITKLYVTCSSPWSYTIARNVHYEDDTPFKITDDIISDLVQSAEAEIITHLHEQSDLPTSDFDIVERATVDITINEYSVEHPIGLKGSVLELSHIAGAIPQEIIDAIHEVQEKLFPHTELRIHTYMLVMYCVSRELFKTIPSRCLIDVTGEATEFGIVENNLLIENTFIPYGSNRFVRDVMAHTGKPVSDINTHIKEFGSTAGISYADLDNDIEEYIVHMEEILNAILARRVLPKEIILTTHKPYTKLFTHIIQTALSRVTESKTRIITIEQVVIDEVTSETVATDVYLALGARFFHKLHGCGELIEN
jgi:cell division ATPase FtsA